MLSLEVWKNSDESAAKAKIERRQVTSESELLQSDAEELRKKKLTSRQAVRAKCAFQRISLSLREYQGESSQVSLHNKNYQSRQELQNGLKQTGSLLKTLEPQLIDRVARKGEAKSF